MAYKQIRAFDPQKMGKRAGWCLQNCREGFGIPYGTYRSAKADMEAQKKEGTFHTGNPPSNVAVPVYFDTVSANEHVMVDDHSIYYSDGKRLSSVEGWKMIGWGEKCDGVRVVEYVPDPPKPQPTTGFLPARGYWKKGDSDARIGKMDSWLRATFPLYAKPCVLGNYFGTCTESAVREFQRRTNLVSDGCVGKLTYAMMKKYGFKG